jgi:hypothetical protein
VKWQRLIEELPVSAFLLLLFLHKSNTVFLIQFIILSVDLTKGILWNANFRKWYSLATTQSLVSGFFHSPSSWMHNDDSAKILLNVWRYLDARYWYWSRWGLFRNCSISNGWYALVRNLSPNLSNSLWILDIFTISTPTPTIIFSILEKVRKWKGKWSNGFLCRVTDLCDSNSLSLWKCFESLL